ncbi:hypothetical protein [Streptomyces sp. NPDC047000]|uniref:hypothetical protein n=1 Tax=Streptomyces sp. NPDC047000 TaxID=3155474 RepID=UPI003410819A
MAFITLTCVVAICDLCRAQNTDNEYGHHYDDPGDALADLTTDYGCDTTPWALLDDGRLICDRRDQAHDELRITVHGWHPTGGAMTVTFTPDTPPLPAHP